MSIFAMGNTIIVGVWDKKVNFEGDNQQLTTIINTYEDNLKLHMLTNSIYGWKSCLDNVLFHASKCLETHVLIDLLNNLYYVNVNGIYIKFIFFFYNSM